jgi:hypothetical protein
MKILLIILLSCVFGALSGQNSFTIHLKSKKITCNDCNKDASVKLDSSLYAYSLSSWDKSKLYSVDTFHYFRIRIKSKKNTIYIYSKFGKSSYILSQKLKEHPTILHDSIIRHTLWHRYNRGTTHFKLREVLPVQLFKQKYLYCDIKEIIANYNYQYNETNYYAKWSRVFIIGDTFYEFEVRNNYPYSERYGQSKKAVQCAFTCLINNIYIVED